MTSEPDVRPGLAPYVLLMDLLLSGRITPSEFEVLYSAVFLGERNPLSTAEFRVLDWIFASADSLCMNSELRTELIGAIGPEELTSDVRRALARLRGQPTD